MNKEKIIKIGPKKRKKIKVSVLNDYLVKGLKDAHIEKYSFILDYRVDRDIPVTEISSSNYYKSIRTLLENHKFPET